MAMSKKDYEVMARIFKESDSLDEVKAKVKIWFAEDNPNFDESRFDKAVSGEWRKYKSKKKLQFGLPKVEIKW